MAEPKVRFKQDNGSSFPAWQTIPMSEVFTEITEKNHPEMPVLSVQQGVGTVLRDSSRFIYSRCNPCFNWKDIPLVKISANKS